MKSVTISDAKNNLSRYLQYVRRGGHVRILDRDTPVADLVPVERAKTPSSDGDDALLRRLERRGWIRRGKAGPLPKECYAPGPADPGDGMLRALLEERRTGR